MCTVVPLDNIYKAKATCSLLRKTRPGVDKVKLKGWLNFSSALNLSILEAGILILVQQVRLILVSDPVPFGPIESLNLVLCWTGLWLGVWGLRDWIGDRA